MSEIFSEQLAAVATLALAILALATAWYARRAFKAQAAELADQVALSKEQTPVLKLQARELQKSLDEREREAEERRQGQASQVAAWFATAKIIAQGDEPWGATVLNASGLPVYDIRAGFYCIDEPVRGLGWTPVACGTSTEMHRVLPPGEKYHFFIPLDVRSQRTECNAEVYTVSITFTDAAGNRWERDPRGALKPLA